MIAMHCHRGSDDPASLYVTDESWGGAGEATTKKADQTHAPCFVYMFIRLRLVLAFSG